MFPYLLSFDRGPILVMKLERDACVKRLLKLIGPMEPSLWDADSTCLRAEFANETKKNGFYSSPHAICAEKELEFFFSGIVYCFKPF